MENFHNIENAKGVINGGIDNKIERKQEVKTHRERNFL